MSEYGQSAARSRQRATEGNRSPRIAGASRSRLLAQFLTESLLLSATGGALGMMTAASCVRLANHWLPQGLLPITEIPLDSSILLFALAIIVATGLLFGFAPA